MTAMNKQNVSKDWAARGFSCDLWVDPPGQRWEDFVHATDELVLVVEGELEFEINGVISHPKIGEELFIEGKTQEKINEANKIKNSSDAVAEENPEEGDRKEAKAKSSVLKACSTIGGLLTLNSLATAILLSLPLLFWRSIL